MNTITRKTFTRSVHTKDLYIHSSLASNYYKKNDLNSTKNSNDDLFKCVINERLSGLYYIDIGSFKDLHSNMNISRDDYPLEKYSLHRIGKFGLTKDISKRITQHKNKKNGYGRWSSTIRLKWMILLPEAQLFKAEGLLSNLLNADRLSLNYTDQNLNRHDELIISDSSKEQRVKKIFKQVSDIFSLQENELAQRYETELLKKDYEIRIRDEREKTLLAQSQLLQLKNEYLKSMYE